MTAESGDRYVGYYDNTDGSGCVDGSRYGYGHGDGDSSGYGYGYGDGHGSGFSTFAVSRTRDVPKATRIPSRRKLMVNSLYGKFASSSSAKKGVATMIVQDETIDLNAVLKEYIDAIATDDWRRQIRAACAAAELVGPLVERCRRAEQERDEALQVLAKIELWTHVLGAALKPPGTDTFGEGMREAKVQVSRIFEAFLDHNAASPRVISWRTRTP